MQVSRKNPLIRLIITLCDRNYEFENGRYNLCLFMKDSAWLVVVLLLGIIISSAISIYISALVNPIIYFILNGKWVLLDSSFDDYVITGLITLALFISVLCGKVSAKLQERRYKYYERKETKLDKAIKWLKSKTCISIELKD